MTTLVLSSVGLKLSNFGVVPHISVKSIADYSMYSTFLTVSSGSVLFSRSNLLKRKDLCFSCLRLYLISHRRSLRSSHLFSSDCHDFRVIHWRTSSTELQVTSHVVFCPFLGLNIVCFKFFFVICTTYNKTTSVRFRNQLFSQDPYVGPRPILVSNIFFRPLFVND